MIIQIIQMIIENKLNNMRQLAFLFFFILFAYISHGQICNCEAIISYKYNKQIYIYKNPMGDITDSIKNDIMNEDFLFVKIIDEFKSYYFADISLSISGDYKTGWIKKDWYIGTNTKRYLANKNMKLYLNPNYYSEKIYISGPLNEQFVEILTCANKWVLIKISIKGEKYKGWIAPEDHCPNNYTTCN